MEHLDELESKSIYIIREAFEQFKKIAILWSIGKDSTTLLHLCRKAFYGKLPFPVIHIDTSYKFPVMYEFRDKYAKEWNLNLIVGRNEEALKQGMNVKKGALECCTALKTNALKQLIDKYKFKALLLGIRRDEHGVRAKERYFCFPKDTLVYGEQIKPIQDIKPGDSVFTHLGSLRKVLAVSSRPYNGKLLNIKTQYNFSILVTPNHEVLAKITGKGEKKSTVQLKGFDGITRSVTLTLTGRKRVVWTNASKINVNDLLYVPKLPKKAQDNVRTLHFVPIQQIIGKNKSLVKTKKQLSWKSAHKSAAKIRESLPLSPAMLRIIGYYIAEGSANLASNQLSFAFHAKEKDLVEDLLRTMRENFGVEGNIRKRGNSFEVLFSSKTLALLFSKIGGRGARKKRLPFFFTRLSKKQLCELVKGCWLGDGSHEKYSTMSKQLANQLRLALLRLGVLTSLREDKMNRYHLGIAGPSKKKFTDIFGIECKVPYIERCHHAREIGELHASELSGMDYGHSRSGGFWVPVREIEEKTYNGIVYDLNVENHSSYVAAGIAVHNSPRDTDFKWDYKNQPPELWDQYKSKAEGETHVRVHPMLHWTELDIWKYIKREGIPVNPMYFAKNGKRYRSLGCMPCCHPIESNAKNLDEIIDELETTKTAERSGRSQDKEQAYMMAKLRALGYM